MKSNRAYSIVLILCLVTLLLVACGSDDEPVDEEPRELTSVRVQLSWTHSNEFAPFYLADDEGHYADEGIEVDLARATFIDEGIRSNAITEVAEGRAQFGVADAGAIMVARAAGTPVVAVMALYQRHPLALVSRADQAIISPQDLIGKRVEISSNSTIIFEALLAAQGIDPEDLNLVVRTDFTTRPIMSNSADVIDAWITREVIALTAARVQINSIRPFDYGVDMYPNLVFTTEAMIRDNPDLVQAFVDASVRGITDAVADQAKAAQATVARDPNLDPRIEEQALVQGLPLLISSASKAGIIVPQSIANTYNMLVEQGVLTTEIDPAACYTLRFLNQIYGED